MQDGHYMKNDDIYSEVIQQLRGKILLKMEGLGEFLEGKIAEEISQIPIYDKGNFLNKLTHGVTSNKSSVTLRIWSSAKHAKFVLGGKVPSAVPKAPIKAWVKRKLSKSPSFARKFSDPKTGKTLPVDSIVFLIMRKIRREGIKERNVFQSVVKEYLNYIERELKNL